MKRLIIIFIVILCCLPVFAKEIIMSDTMYVPDYMKRECQSDTIHQTYRVPLLTFKDKRTSAIANELFSLIRINIPGLRMLTLQFTAISSDTVWLIKEFDIPNPIFDQNSFGVYLFNSDDDHTPIFMVNTDTSFASIKDDISPTDETGRPLIIDDIFELSGDIIVYNTTIIYKPDLFVKDEVGYWCGILSTEKKIIEPILYIIGYDHYENTSRILNLYKAFCNSNI